MSEKLRGVLWSSVLWVEGQSMSEREEAGWGEREREREGGRNEGVRRGGNRESTNR